MTNKIEKLYRNLKKQQIDTISLIEKFVAYKDSHHEINSEQLGCSEYGNNEMLFDSYLNQYNIFMNNFYEKMVNIRNTINNLEKKSLSFRISEDVKIIKKNMTALIEKQCEDLELY